MPSMAADPEAAEAAEAAAPAPALALVPAVAEQAAVKRTPMEHLWRIRNPNIAKADAHGHLLFCVRLQVDIILALCYDNVAYKVRKGKIA